MTMIISGDNGVTFPNSTVQASAGQVLQVVVGTTNTQVQNSTNSQVSTGLTATITPKFSTSKILIISNIMGVTKDSTNSDNRIDFILKRGSTQLDNSGANSWTQGTAMNLRIHFAHSFYDSPATTSSTTYTWYFDNANNSNAAYVNKDGNSGTSQITLMEIAA